MSNRQITGDQVRHVAKLSRLRLDESEADAITDQLEAVLAYIAKLNELDVEGVEPMAHPLRLTNVLRDDEPRTGLTADEALANAPEASHPYFKVPKVLGDASGA